jgi:hypothetical protein
MGAEGGFTIIDRAKLDAIAVDDFRHGLRRSLEEAIRYHDDDCRSLQAAIDELAAPSGKGSTSGRLLAAADAALATILPGEIYGHQVLSFGWGTNICAFLNCLDDYLLHWAAADVVVACEETWT